MGAPSRAGWRGAAPGMPAPRRPATATGSGVNEHATTRSRPRSSRSGSAGAHAGIAHPVPSRCSLRRSRHQYHGGIGTVRRRPVRRRLPMLSIANPAASPPAEPAADRAAPGPRRARVCPPGTRACGALEVRGFGVAGSSRFGRAWGSSPAMDSGPGRRQTCVETARVPGRSHRAPRRR